MTTALKRKHLNINSKRIKPISEKTDKTLAKFITVSLTILMLFICISSCFSVSGEKGLEYKTVVVEKGGTLWDIAGEYAGNKDVRRVISDIKELNNLSGSDLYYGQVIKLPVY